MVILKEYYLIFDMVRKQSTNRSVEDISEHDDSNSSSVEEHGEEEQTVVVLTLTILELLDPRLVPRVDKVDDENKLNDNEEKAADEAEVHEDLLEGAVARDVESADEQTDECERLEEPEAVLDVGARVSR